MNTTEDTALILAGSGYTIEIAPEAITRRDDLLARAETVTTVTSNLESQDASFHLRRLAELRIEVEKARKQVKEPVNRIGKLIDQTAKDYLEDVAHHESRLKCLIADHAEEQERRRHEAEEVERAATEKARLLREQGTASEALAAARERLAASDAVVDASLAGGVKFVWDYEVADILLLATRAPRFVTITPKRAEILADMRSHEDVGLPMDDAEYARIGLKIVKRPVVSTR